MGERERKKSGERATWKEIEDKIKGKKEGLHEEPLQRHHLCASDHLCHLALDDVLVNQGRRESWFAQDRCV